MRLLVVLSSSAARWCGVNVGLRPDATFRRVGRPGPRATQRRTHLQERPSGWPSRPATAWPAPRVDPQRGQPGQRRRTAQRDGDISITTGEYHQQRPRLRPANTHRRNNLSQNGGRLAATTRVDPGWHPGQPGFSPPASNWTSPPHKSTTAATSVPRVQCNLTAVNGITNAADTLPFSV